MVSNHLFKGEGDGIEKLLVHDNTITLIQVKAKEDLTVFINYTNNWTLNDTNGEVKLSNDNMTVMFKLVAKPNSQFINVTNSSITVYLGEKSMLKIFIENIEDVDDKDELPGALWFDDTEPNIFYNLGADNFGGSLTVTGPANSPNVHVETYLDGFIFQVKEIKAQELKFILSSKDISGKFVSVTALKETLEIPEDNTIEVLLDGESIPEVDDISELKIGQAGYYRTYDNEGEQIVISVPHFSEHQIHLRFNAGIESLNEDSAIIWDYLDYALIIGVLLVILIAALHIYIVRRKD
jgi:hypothetical protein